MSEVVWLKAQPRNPATAAMSEVLLAGGGQDLPYRHPVTGAQELHICQGKDEHREHDRSK